MKFNYKYKIGAAFGVDGDLNCIGEIIDTVGKYSEPYYRCVIKTYNANKELVRREQTILSESRVTKSIEKTTEKMLKTTTEENNNKKSMNIEENNTEITKMAEELEKIYNAKEKYLTLNQQLAFEKLLKLLVE